MDTINRENKYNIKLKLGGGGYPLDGLYRESPPNKGTFFRLQVNERVGISLDEVQCMLFWLEIRPKRANRCILWL